MQTLRSYVLDPGETRPKEEFGNKLRGGKVLQAVVPSVGEPEKLAPARSNPEPHFPVENVPGARDLCIELEQIWVLFFGTEAIFLAAFAEAILSLEGCCFVFFFGFCVRGQTASKQANKNK